MTYSVLKPAGHGGGTEEIELTLYGYVFAPGTDPAVGSPAYVRYSLTGFHEDTFEAHGGATFSGNGLDNHWVYQKDYGMQAPTAPGGIPENPLPPSDPMHFIVTANVANGLHLYGVPFQLFNRFGQIMTITTPTPNTSAAQGGSGGGGRPSGFSPGQAFNYAAALAPPLIPLLISHQAGSDNSGAAGATVSAPQARSTVAEISITQPGPTFGFNSVTKQLTALPVGMNAGIQGIQLYPATEPSLEAANSSLRASGAGQGTGSGKTSAVSGTARNSVLPKIVQPIYFSFSPLTETGPVIDGTATFSGGDFTIYDSTEQLKNALLTGDFGSSSLFLDGGAGGILTFDDVTYTGGSDLAQFLADNPGNPAIGGSFSIDLTNIAADGLIPLNGDVFPSFTASGNIGTFSVTDVPEPSPACLALLPLLGVLGRLVRRRLTSGGAAGIIQ